MLDWPETLPQDLHLQSSEGAPSNLVEFQPTNGAPVLHQTGRSHAFKVSGQLRLTDAQAAALLTFYKDDLGMGQRKFRLRRTGTNEIWATQFDASTPYTLATKGAGYAVTLNLWHVWRVE